MIMHDNHFSPMLKERIFFCHVPKTGGTTLDSILFENSVHTGAGTYSRFCSLASDAVTFAALRSNSSLRYLAGHLPAEFVYTNNFECKITILRDPLSTFISQYNYSKKILADHNNIGAIDSVQLGFEYSIYNPYFGDADLGAIVLNKRYGTFYMAELYKTSINIDSALERIKKFDQIYDFEALSSHIQSLIVEKGMFPYSAIERKRKTQYSESPERSRLLDLISPNDISFYNAAMKMVSPIKFNSDCYQEYRNNYPADCGITLSARAEYELDLRNPVGIGWNEAEESEKKQFFRYASQETATIEIPIKEAGFYKVLVYVLNNSKDIEPSFDTLLSLVGGIFDQSTHSHGGNLITYELNIEFKSFGWVDIVVRSKVDFFDILHDRPDQRDLGCALGAVHVKRLH